MAFIIFKLIVLGIVLIVFIGRAISASSKEGKISNNPEAAASKLKVEQPIKFLNISTPINEIYKILRDISNDSKEIAGYSIDKLVLSSDNELILSASKIEKIKPLDSLAWSESISNLNKVYISALLYVKDNTLYVHGKDLISENKTFGGKNDVQKIANEIRAKIDPDVKDEKLLTPSSDNNEEIEAVSDVENKKLENNNVDIRKDVIDDYSISNSPSEPWEQKFNSLSYDDYLALKDVVSKDLPSNLDKATIKQLIISHMKDNEKDKK